MLGHVTSNRPTRPIRGKKLAKTGNSFLATANEAVRIIYLLSYVDRPVRDIYGLEMMGQTVLLSLIISLALASTATNSSHSNVFIEKAVEVAYICVCKVPPRRTRSPAIAEGPRDAGVPVEIW